MLRRVVALIVAASALLPSVTAGANVDAAERPGSAAGVIARQLLRTGDVTTDVLATCLGDWTDRERIGQLIVPGVDYERLRDAVPLIEEGVIGGVVVLGRPGPDDATAVRNVLEELRSAAAVPPMIAIDEEGGRVQRLASVIGTLPSARSQAALDPNEELVDLMREHGTALRQLGFTVDLAPVLDVGGGPGIGDRSYGDDADSVVAATMAVADGLIGARVARGREALPRSWPRQRRLPPHPADDTADRRASSGRPAAVRALRRTRRCRGDGWTSRCSRPYRRAAGQRFS